MSWLPRFLEQERANMLEDLMFRCFHARQDMQADPKEHTDPGCDEPSIDVRLCIDRYESKPGLPEHYDWCFRTGLVDFDQRHSTLCVASSIGLGTEPRDLLNDLLNDLLSEVMDRETV